MDFDKDLNGRTELLKSMQIPFVMIVNSHPNTLTDIDELIEMKRCKGVWIRLLGHDAVGDEAAPRKHKRRMMALTTLLMRLIQKDLPIIVDAQAQNITWNFPEMVSVVNSDMVRRKGFRNTLHRWCSFIQPGEMLASSTSQRIFSNLGLSSDGCICGRRSSEHSNSQGSESLKTEYHFGDLLDQLASKTPSTRPTSTILTDKKSWKDKRKDRSCMPFLLTDQTNL